MTPEPRRSVMMYHSLHIDTDHISASTYTHGTRLVCLIKLEDGVYTTMFAKKNIIFLPFF